MAGKTTGGPIDAVKCPSCGRPNDFRDIHAQQLLDTGHTLKCDHCRRIMKVTAMRVIHLVQVAVDGATAPNRTRLPPPRQATTLGPAATQRLLHGTPRRRR